MRAWIYDPFKAYLEGLKGYKAYWNSIQFLFTCV